MFALIRKIFYRLIHLHPLVDRFFRYRDPRQYWIHRGGETYFQEQEAVRDRTERSRFMAERIAAIEYRTVLEIGAGYGKQLKNLRRADTELVAGIDFSRPQLLKAREICADIRPCLAEADAQFLPFPDKSFDAVMSSAVILHNSYEKARSILSEMIRVSRRYLIHNEDMDITFSRYGYDLGTTYRKMGFEIIFCGPIPCAPDPGITQFTIARIPETAGRLKPVDILLQYH